MSKIRSIWKFVKNLCNKGFVEKKGINLVYVRQSFQMKGHQWVSFVRSSSILHFNVGEHRTHCRIFSVGISQTRSCLIYLFVRKITSESQWPIHITVWRGEMLNRQVGVFLIYSPNFNPKTFLFDCLKYNDSKLRKEVLLN